MLEEIKEKWDDILLNIKEEHDISEVSYRTWLLPLIPDSVDKDILTILVPDSAFISYVKKKYEFLLTITIEEITGFQCKLDFKLKSDVKEPEKENRLINVNNNTVSQLALQNANLNPRYTFDTFVVGKNNNLAHAASLAVAESPGEIYNPLFIYGGVGLGKTHLMHSVAHFILKNNPSAKILYVTSEKFTNELIDAIRNKNNVSTTEFREKYRNVDVLLIDDIQFIIKKESTQTEFFNTFNELYNNKKQIILSSDQPPKELQSLNERIRSRFECGIPIDIHEPDYETRMAILKTKAEMDHLNDIPEEVFQYIAENVTNNIRELEGALHKIGIFSKLMKEEVTLETAKESLKDLINKEKNETITGETILKTVSEHMNISPDDIRSKKRSQDIATARQVVMYLCRKLTVMSLQSAGNIVGGHYADRFTPERVVRFTLGMACLALVGIFFGAHVRYLSLALMCLTTACLFCVSSPQQLLILENSRGGEMLGAALVQVAFNLGNALGAYVGGLPIGHGLGYEYTALPGAAFVLLGMTAAMIYIRKYPRHEQR